VINTEFLEMLIVEQPVIMAINCIIVLVYECGTPGQSLVTSDIHFLDFVFSLNIHLGNVKSKFIV